MIAPLELEFSKVPGTCVSRAPDKFMYVFHLNSSESNDLQNSSKAAASSRNKSASVEEQQYYASSETYYSPSELQRDENDEDGAYYVASNQHGGRGMSAPGKKPTVRH
jgi:hypothetical protein